MGERSSFREFYPALCGIEQKISTVEQYIRAVDYAYRVLIEDNEDVQYGQKLWFRGLKSSDYQLIPSIDRNGLNVEYELMFLSKFKARAYNYMDQVPIRPGNDSVTAYWDWLFLMQYYGVPTRLLDWTEDALVALVFAIDPDASEEEKANDCVVWCLNPVALNTAFTFHEYYPSGYIPNVHEKGVYDMFGPFKNSFQNKKPAAVYGPMNNARSIVQRMAHTLFPYNVPLTAMDNLPDHRKYLYKIVVDKDSRDYISGQLKRYGITKSQLMPELSSLAQAISDEEFKQ